MPCEPRFVFLKKTNPHDDLGIVLKGGNAVGIFVHNIQPSSLASGQQGLRCGDQILEVSDFLVVFFLKKEYFYLKPFP